MSSLIHLHGFHFCLYLQTKSASKEKFRQDSNHCKSVLEATKLAYASKQESNTSQKDGSCDFYKIFHPGHSYSTPPVY